MSWSTCALPEGHEGSHIAVHYGEPERGDSLAGGVTEAAHWPDEVERVQVVDVRPGDTIVATVDPKRRLSAHAFASLRSGLCEQFPQQHVVLLEGVDLHVMREVLP